MRKHLLALSPSGPLVKIGQLVFRKQLLRLGRWVHPADNAKFFEVTADLCDRLVRNFDERNYNDFVPVQLAKDAAQPHQVGPDDTVGRIVGLQRGDDGLYGLIEFGDPALTEKATKNLIPGVSAGINLEYHNKEQNRQVGPVLRHVVLCNEPYIKNLRGFEQVPLAEADTNEDYEVLEFAEVQRTAMKREHLEAIAKKLGIDVVKFAADEALLAEVNRLMDTTAVTLAEVPVLKTKATAHDVLLAENTTLKAENTTLKAGAPDAAKVVELSEKLRVTEQTATAQATQIAELQLGVRKSEASVVVDGFIRKGQMVPAQRDGMIELAVSNRKLFDSLYTATSPVIVDLSERGITEPGVPVGAGKLNPAQVAAEVSRYSKMIPGAKAVAA